MPQRDTAPLEQFVTVKAKPADCLERGVAVPFTAPVLFGARLRRSRGHGLEAVVPHPAGREGWFILPWSSAVDALKPTLADRALVAALGSDTPSPASLRIAARSMAESGLAGRVARRAALESVQDVARSPLRCVALIQDFSKALREWMPLAPLDEDRHRVKAMSEGAIAVAKAAATLLAPSLDPASGRDAAARVAQAEWVMNGWDLMAILWEDALPEQRSALLRRCLALAPPPASEMLRWPGGQFLTVEIDARSPPSRLRTFTVARCEAAFSGWLLRA